MTLVIGAGVAGTAAVYRATTRGQRCVWIQAGLGATAASSGALDWDPDDEGPAKMGAPDAARTLDPELVRFGRELFDWQLPEHGVWVVTQLGDLRWARGADACVLDVNGLQPGVIAVLDAGKLDWDAERVCAALNRHSTLNERGLQAFPLPLQGVAVNGAVSDVHFAHALCEQAGFVPALGRALGAMRSEGRVPRAILAGPWLLENNTALQALRGAAALSEFGVTIGETLSPPYGLAGQRFEQSREQFTLTRPGLRIVQGRALRVERLAAGYRVSVAGPAPNQTQDFEAARCVLALGGASSGALQLDAVHHLRLGLELSPPQPLQHRGRPWLQPAAETGVDLQAFGMQAVLELGLPETLEPGRLQVVGDLVADRPRSLLRAAQSGLDAVS